MIKNKLNSEITALVGAALSQYEDLFKLEGKLNQEAVLNGATDHKRNTDIDKNNLHLVVKDAKLAMLLSLRYSLEEEIELAFNDYIEAGGV